jgi:hypothetical protein
MLCIEIVFLIYMVMFISISIFLIIIGIYDLNDPRHYQLGITYISVGLIFIMASILCASCLRSSVYERKKSRKQHRFSSQNPQQDPQ